MRDRHDRVTTDIFGDPPIPPIPRSRRSLAPARTARDAALASVATNATEEWMAHGLQLLRAFAKMRVDFIGEEFRQWATSTGCLVRPHHHNAWGALLRTGALQGFIRLTDRARQMQTTKSHARRSPVWEWCGDA